MRERRLVLKRCIRRRAILRSVETKRRESLLFSIRRLFMLARFRILAGDQDPFDLDMVEQASMTTSYYGWYSRIYHGGLPDLQEALLQRRSRECGYPFLPSSTLTTVSRDLCTTQLFCRLEETVASGGAMRITPTSQAREIFKRRRCCLRILADLVRSLPLLLLICPLRRPDEWRAGSFICCFGSLPAVRSMKYWSITG